MRLGHRQTNEYVMTFAWGRIFCYLNITQASLYICRIDSASRPTVCAHESAKQPRRPFNQYPRKRIVNICRTAIVWKCICACLSNTQTSNTHMKKKLAACTSNILSWESGAKTWVDECYSTPVWDRARYKTWCWTVIKISRAQPPKPIRLDILLTYFLTLNHVPTSIRSLYFHYTNVLWKSGSFYYLPVARKWPQVEQCTHVIKGDFYRPVKVNLSLNKDIFIDNFSRHVFI